MTTLEKIKAEIENIKDFEVVNGGLYIRQYDVVHIIDKYAKQEPTEIECFSKGFVRAMRRYAEQAEIQADYDRQKASGMTDEEWEYGKGGE